MNHELLIALLAGLGGMLGWGLADFFAKKTIDTIGPIPSLVWAHGFGTTLFALVAAGQVLFRGGHITVPSTLTTWLGLAFFGALQMVVYWLVYEGFERGQLAVLNPVFASYSGVVALISVIFLGEHFGASLAVGLLAVFVGIVMINLDIPGLKSKKLNITPGLPQVAAGALLAAGWTVGWDRFVHGHDALSYALFMYAFMSLAAFVLAALLRVPYSAVPTSLRKFLLLIGLSEVVAYLSISWGFSATTHTSIVALVSGSFSLPTIVLAFIFLKERISRLQLGAIGIIILGVVLVSVS